MSEWWYVVALAVIAAVAIAYLLSRRSGTRDRAGLVDTTSRDFGEERETSRVGGMSAEDREWEAASIERNRKASEDEQVPPRSS